METTTYADILNDKKLSVLDYKKEIEKVRKYKQTEVNANCFVGNNLLYQFQMAELCKTHRKGKKSLHDVFHDDEEKQKLIAQTEKRGRTGTPANRIFEAWRINNGSINFFKMCNAAYLYKKYNATKVLDMTAGWGGRMLAAINLGIEYTGFDTNVSLKTGYDRLLEAFDNPPNCKMIWSDCIDHDFSRLDFDFMMTSPPYEDIEIYEHMTTYKEFDYYNCFLIPLIDKSRTYCKGLTAINISPQMYNKLIFTYKYEECAFTEDLKEQKNGKAPDMIYFWRGFIPLE
jgi:hypothetical protein